MKRIILITGGQRSGKSKKAEELALSLSPNPVYMATAHIWDEEFRERVRIHQERRGPQWTNIEEEMYLSRHDMTGRVVVIDCVTLWLTNLISIEHGTLFRKSEGGVRCLHVERCHLYLRHKRDWQRRRQHQRPATPIHRLARLDEPVYCLEGRRSYTNGFGHTH